MIKNCIICGKQIEVNNSRYCCCSKECRKIRNAAHRKERAQRPEIREAARKAYHEKARRNPRIVPCRICGEPVAPTFISGRMCRKFYHEDCIIDEGIKAIQEGAPWDDKRIARAYGRGISRKELVEIWKDERSR